MQKLNVYRIFLSLWITCYNGLVNCLPELKMTLRSLLAKDTLIDSDIRYLSKAGTTTWLYQGLYSRAGRSPTLLDGLAGTQGTHCLQHLYPNPAKKPWFWIGIRIRIRIRTSLASTGIWIVRLGFPYVPLRNTVQLMAVLFSEGATEMAGSMVRQFTDWSGNCFSGDCYRSLHWIHCIIQVQRHYELYPSVKIFLPNTGWNS